MTITLKDQNSVWIAVGAGCVGIRLHEEDLIHEDNVNLWRVSGVENCIMGSVRAGGIDLDRIRYQKHLGLSAPLTMNNLILKVIPKLKKVFEETDMMDGKESWQTFSVAKGDKAFVILPSFTCWEIEDFDVRGNGEAQVLLIADAVKIDASRSHRAHDAVFNARNTPKIDVVFMDQIFFMKANPHASCSNGDPDGVLIF